jgi:hypothetical protein
MDLPLLKNDITTTKAVSQNEIYSRYMESGISAYTLEISEILTTRPLARKSEAVKGQVD